VSGEGDAIAVATLGPEVVRTMRELDLCDESIIPIAEFHETTDVPRIIIVLDLLDQQEQAVLAGRLVAIDDARYWAIALGRVQPNSLAAKILSQKLATDGSHPHRTKGLAVIQIITPESIILCEAIENGTDIEEIMAAYVGLLRREKGDSETGQFGLFWRLLELSNNSYQELISLIQGQGIADITLIVQSDEGKQFTAHLTTQEEGPKAIVQFLELIVPLEIDTDEQQRELCAALGKCGTVQLVRQALVIQELEEEAIRGLELRHEILQVREALEEISSGE